MRGRAHSSSMRAPRGPVSLLLLYAPSVAGWAVSSAPRWSAPRAGAPLMFEAYDLMPVMDCLKAADMDAVNACFDTLSPWLQLTDTGDVVFSQNAVNGFIGGSVGALGTVAATMVKKDQVKDRLKCPYCDGTGIISCGVCLGSSRLATHEGGTLSYTGCNTCESTGSVVCINCQGSGLNVPDDFIQALGDSEAGFSEEDYIGLFDEVKFPNREDAGVPGGPPAAAPPTPVAAGRAASAVPDITDVRDVTGGMG